MVLIGGTALIVFGFSNDLSEAKQVYLTAEVTSNTAEPLTLHLWHLDKKAELKDIIVSVKTPTGISTGTLDPAHEPFFEGQIVPIGFDTGFPKGNYLITVTGIFADGTTQVLFTKTMNVEAEGQTIKEVSKQKLILVVVTPKPWKPNQINVSDTTTYTDITNILHWTLNFGYPGAVTVTSTTPMINEYHEYVEAEFSGESKKEFLITYTAYYKDGKTKTTVQKNLILYKSGNSEGIGKYIKNYKIATESLNGTNKLGDIVLIGTLSTEIWRTDISGRYIEKAGVSYPALQINTKDFKAEATSINFTCDTDIRIGDTQHPSGYIYKGTTTNFYLNTTEKSSININLKLYNATDYLLAEQTTQIIIRE